MRCKEQHTPLEGMDNEQIKRFALFLFKENHNKSKQLDEMIARLDEIGKGCQPPAYREAKNRLSDMDWNTSVQNLLNWADRGAILLNKLIPALKKIALEDGANTDDSLSELMIKALKLSEKLLGSDFRL